MAQPALPPYHTLSEIMAAAIEIARHDIEEDRFQENLLVQDPSGLIVAMLAVGPGRMQADTVRMVLGQYQEATLAVYTVQAWMASVAPEHPLFPALSSGRITPSQLPADLVKDIVLLIGESATGEEAQVQYEISPPTGGGPPRMADEPMSTAGLAQQWNRFRPMFPQRHAAPSRHEVSKN